MMSGLFYSGFSILSVATDVLFFLTALPGFILLLFAFIAPILTYLNVFGIRDRLFETIGILPGFRSRTTWKAALGIFGYTLLASIVLLSIAGLFLPPDNIEVSDTALSSEEVTAGDSIEVSGVVENVGNETLSETIELTANGEVIETQEVTLEPGVRRELTFNTQLSDPGEYEIELHDSTIATVVVRDNIVFDETTLSEEEIGEGQSVEITGVVANVGNTSDTISVDLLVDGDVEDTKEIALESGEEREFRFTRRFDEEGEYDIEVNGELVGSLSVVQLQPAEFEIADDSLSEEEVERGDTVEITAVVRNTGGQSGDLDVELTADGSVVDSREVTLASGEERSITFSYSTSEIGETDLEMNGKSVGTLSVFPNPTDDDAFTNFIRNLLSDEGIDVQSIEVSNGRDQGGEKSVIVTYRTSSTSMEEIAGSEMGAFTGSFVEAVRRGWDIDSMAVVVGDQQGTAIATYVIQEEWVQQYIDGEISGEEFRSRIINTWTPF